MILYLENEAVVEALRQKLHRTKNFNIREAYEILDMDRDGYLSLFEV